MPCATITSMPSSAARLASSTEPTCSKIHAGRVQLVDPGPRRVSPVEGRDRDLGRADHVDLGLLGEHGDEVDVERSGRAGLDRLDGLRPSRARGISPTPSEPSAPALLTAIREVGRHADERHAGLGDRGAQPVRVGESCPEDHGVASQRVASRSPVEHCQPVPSRPAQLSQAAADKAFEGEVALPVPSGHVLGQLNRLRQPRHGPAPEHADSGTRASTSDRPTGRGCVRAPGARGSAAAGWPVTRCATCATTAGNTRPCTPTPGRTWTAGRRARPAAPAGGVRGEPHHGRYRHPRRASSANAGAWARTHPRDLRPTHPVPDVRRLAGRARAG